MDWLPADLVARLVQEMKELAQQEAARSAFTRCTRRDWRYLPV
jgi:hypothetical protein